MVRMLSSVRDGIVEGAKSTSTPSAPSRPFPAPPFPGHHAPPPRTPPLEPQAQRTLASGRADRARPAVSGMLGARTAAVKLGTTPRISRNDASLRRHDGGHRALAEPIRERAGRDRGLGPARANPQVREELPDHRVDTRPSNTFAPAPGIWDSMRSGSRDSIAGRAGGGLVPAGLPPPDASL